MPRSIVHLDADAFFASVEQAADARLRGKPVAVGGEKRGIIASASYEARKLGIYTPMPTSRARKLCPKLIVLPGDFEKYEQFSRWMFGYAYDFTPDVEIASIDEGYFDLSANLTHSPTQIAQTIRHAIGQTLKISVSEGIATNKLVSQVASKIKKPAAFIEVRSGQEMQFLQPLPNNWLPGIGPKTAERLNAAGLAFIRQIAATPLEMLELLLGRQAFELRQFANGIDDRPVVPMREPAKSYSQQQTFPEDVTNEEYATATLLHMADELFNKVRVEGRSIRTLTVKVRYNDMAEDQHAESLREPTDLETDVYGRLQLMLKAAWKRRVSLRMVSLKLSQVYNGRFYSGLLIDTTAQRRDARERQAHAIDELRKTRGWDIVLRGHDLQLKNGPDEPTPNRSKISNKKNIQPIFQRHSKYVPLNIRSYYSFLDSTLSPRDIVQLAVQYELPAIAITDSGNLHGAWEFAIAAREAGIKPIFGAELNIEGSPLLLYVENTTGWRNLCHLLSCESPDDESVAQREARPRKRQILDGSTEGLIAVAVDGRCADFFPDRFYLAVTSPMNSSCPSSGIVCPRVHYATPADRLKYDIVQSIRTRTLLRQTHPQKRIGGNYHFRSPSQLGARFLRAPALLENTLELAARCNFQFPFGKPQFPAYQSKDGSTSRDLLRRLVFDGLRRRYGSKSQSIKHQVEEELSIISAVGYEDYFLMVWDILQTCKARGIEWITRGSAADSLVCYCLGISNVCPIRFDLYFRRFLNRERMELNKLPDIDVDFAHDRKDDVVDLIFEKYGDSHCAMVGGFNTYQARGAVGDVAKVLGVSEFQIRRFTEHFPWAGASNIIETLKENVECRDLPITEEPYKTALEMAGFLDGFPRHPKMHPCGVVLSRNPMHDLTPTFRSGKGHPATHFDMDGVEDIGLVKMDILAQGGLAVMRDTKAALAKRGITVDLERLEPWQNPQVWDLIASGNARGVHHIESPSMVSLCHQSNVREIDGLIAIVSVIRPGAANEGKKQSFIRRYQKFESVTYPHPSLENCLKSTFGLIVYEEHILQVCEAFAGLPPGRADVLRRALGRQKEKVIETIRSEFFHSALARGHSPEKIEEVWGLVKSFEGYAFCKAHSTVYGIEAYQSAWLKRYYPMEFMAALLTNGKGFYQPLVYVLECHRIGILLLPPSINEPGPSFIAHKDGIRVPVTRVKGLTERTVQALVKERQSGPFPSIRNFYSRVAPQSEEMESMIRAGAFDEFGQSRTQQFWEVQSLIRSFGNAAHQGWILPPPEMKHFTAIPLNEPTHLQRLEWETDLFGFAVSDHPLALFKDVAWETYCPVARLGEHVGERVVTCGLVVEQRTHHQITGEPMKFLSLADWTGIVETELFAATYRSYGLASVRYPVLEIEALVEPFENRHGFSLRVLRAGKPRKREDISILPSRNVSVNTELAPTQ